MAFLKLLRSEFEPNLRSSKVDQTRSEFESALGGKSWEEYKSRNNVHLDGLHQALLERQAELDEMGDATRVKVWGLPLPDRHPKLRTFPSSWTVDDSELQDMDSVPGKLPVSERNAHDTGFDVNRHAIWLYQRKVYLANDPELNPDDVRALLNQEANKRRLALEKAHSLQAMSERLDKPRQRDRIAQDVRIEVWQRDGGRCVECESQANLEFDHIIPFAMGGSNTARNLQLLCGDCNRRKGMTLG